MKIYKYIFGAILVLITMWLITNIITSLRVLSAHELVGQGTVLERLYFVGIASKLFFLFIIGISLKIGSKFVKVTLFIPVFWLLHAYLNVGELFIEIEYLVLPMLLIVSFYIKEKLSNRKVGLPTSSVYVVSIIRQIKLVGKPTLQ